MYVSISQESTRQRREEIKHEVMAARQAMTSPANREASPRPMRNLRWELARYAGLLSKRLRK